MVKKTIVSLAVGVMALTAPILSASASEIYRNDISVVGGYAIIAEDAGIVELDVQGTIPSLLTAVANGTLRGTWTTGNLGTNFFSTVVGNSGSGAARADGRGSVINGNGTLATGGWQYPGYASRGSAFRTPWGTNSAHWYLRSPSN